MTQQCHFASMAARLSSTGISRSLLPHIPSVHLSLQSTAALAVGLLHNPYSPAPSCCAFQGTRVPVQGLYGCSKGCLILIPFRLSQISCFTLSLKCFSSDSDNCPDVGIGPLLQFPHPPRAGPVLLTLPFFPSSFLLPSFAWCYIFFPGGQALLPALSWCSACTSVSVGAFLMYPWREMCSTSTCSSATPRQPLGANL